jgi:hypothetical protein
MFCRGVRNIALIFLDEPEGLKHKYPRVRIFPKPLVKQNILECFWHTFLRPKARKHSGAGLQKAMPKTLYLSLRRADVIRSEEHSQTTPQ